MYIKSASEVRALFEDVLGAVSRAETAVTKGKIDKIVGMVIESTGPTPISARFAGYTTPKTPRI